MIQKEFIVNLKGKDFVTFPGLLDLAHQQDLRYVSTELIQIPDADNGHTAIVTAKVETSKGTFTGIGDANPVNVGNKMIAVHSIRMAETRAIARALRFATNIGMTALEEIGGDVVSDDMPTHTEDKPMTEKQRGMLENFSESNWLGEEEQASLKMWLSKPRTTTGASKAIEHYMALRDERQGGRNA